MYTEKIKRAIGSTVILWGIVVFGLSLCAAAYSQAEYTSAGLRNPFQIQLPRRPARVVSEAKAKGASGPAFVLVVQSVVAGGPMPQAIIDGKILRIGDRTKEAIITDITKEGVEVLYQGETLLFPAPSQRFITVKNKDAVGIKEEPPSQPGEANTHIADGTK